MRARVVAMLVAACAACVATAAATGARADTLTPDDLARKNEGGYVTGLPLFNYTPDTGYGFGARAYYYWDGDRDDPRFAHTPYLYRVFLQAFVSTRGTQFHWLDFDAPKIGGSEYRIRSQLILQRATNSNYFGDGTSALAPLAFPGATGTYKSLDAFEAAQQQIINGQTYAKWNQYDLLRPLLIASVERLFLGDHLRVLGGVGFSYARIRDYSGESVDALDPTGATVQAPEAQTKLSLDCAAGKVVGCTGGRDDYFRLGISYDTRDFEPDPNSGVFLDAGLDAGTVALGSQYDYLRFLATARGYWSPIADLADLVVAGRALIQMQTNGTPFFSMNTLPFTDDPRAGLGGNRTMRGYAQDRFVGSVMTLVNGEVRWTFVRGTLWKQKLAVILAPFVDIGRPYDSLGQLTWRDWRPAYGAAVRIPWNLATIISLDYGVSDEGTGFYVNFNHMF
jgi:hypothetical protein